MVVCSRLAIVCLKGKAGRLVGARRWVVLLVLVVLRVVSMPDGTGLEASDGRILVRGL